MHKTIAAFLGLLCAGLALPAMAGEKFVLIDHTDGTDPFWPVVLNGAQAAAKQVGAELIFRHPSKVDAVEEAQIIEAATAQKPDGMIISILDPTVIGPAIKAAVDAGIPVVSINSGAEEARKFGVLLHVGQPEYPAGKMAGERAKAAGRKKYLCLNQEAQNIALRERCQGFADGFGQKLNMIDSTNDPTEIKARTTAALMADPSIDTLLATGPHVCVPALAALHDLGKERSIYLACFDLSPEVVAAIKDGRVAFAIDQQQYLQGYLPVIYLDLYKRYGLLQANDVLSGPGFVTKENADQVAKLAGTVR
ncbi:MAG: sugar ABC transporter substrate-binding protein [Alphaproteobacteria bacterium]|nr:sugar ABC transporter substrate-binding protein [Alphaproteobacteria bacterium]